MNRHHGSALLVVLFLIAAISTLLMNLNYRLSLLVQTVIQREKHLQYHYAAQACMFYAIHLAKNNWHYLHKHIQSDRLLYTDVPWYVRSEEKAYASISFQKAGQGLSIAIELLDDTHKKRESISCKVVPVNKIQKEIQLMISDWNEP